MCPGLEDTVLLVIRWKKAAPGWAGSGKLQESAGHTQAWSAEVFPFRIRTWTKVHKIKKMRFRMDSPGMML